MREFWQWPLFAPLSLLLATPCTDRPAIVCVCVIWQLARMRCSFASRPHRYLEAVGCMSAPCVGALCSTAKFGRGVSRSLLVMHRMHLRPLHCAGRLVLCSACLLGGGWSAGMLKSVGISILCLRAGTWRVRHLVLAPPTLYFAQFPVLFLPNNATRDSSRPPRSRPPA